MKRADSLPFMDQFPPKRHIIFSLVHKNHSVKLKRIKNKIEETRSKSIFCHDAHAPRIVEIWHKNGRILAVYGPISPKLPQNVIFGS